ncbi:MAG: ParB/RepB/Spo0J family partition protein [Lamprobacter sp.]|uniref:ParB/RepB/Spo0J family partition protein n=1 Tax=Lamprobacter sp. TaxID=3100796 RepID=UPI002B259269|nr:ParB/RepB/Spo0J family partition protein [Lamprobacter sp.]MEA3643021.1 ParB/RepB/Spo0J family partition protein [Lamprobacter sp.]
MSLKGISSLAELMDTPVDAGAQEIELALIDPDPNQPRTSFDEQRLETLAASLKAQGVIEPLIVSLHPDVAGRYMLIAGERRWRAAGMAGLQQVPVVVRELNDAQRLAVQLIENIDREELSVMEEALAVARLLNLGRKPKEVAEMLGKTAAWVSLRKKIATHQKSLEPFVAKGRTGDAETLAMLVDLQKIDPHAFKGMLKQEQLGRTTVREALARAKAREAEPESPETSSLPEPTDVAAPDEQVSHANAEEQDDGSTTQAPSSEVSGTGHAATDGEGDPFAEIALALEARLGLPVTIEAPELGRHGELRIRFADLLELDGIRKTLI